MDPDILYYHYLGGGFLNDALSKLGVKPDDKEYKLLKTPKTAPPHKYETFANLSYQMDLMEMPDDNGFHYILNVVSVFNRKTDCEPLKSKNPDEVMKAFAKIYGRDPDILNIKSNDTILVDDGSEFKGEMKQFCRKHDLRLVVTRAGYKKDEAIVESKNRLYKQLLLKFLSYKSLKENEYNNSWSGILFKVRDILNERADKQFSKKEIPNPFELNIDVPKTEPKFKVGDQVHRIEYSPKFLFENNAKLHGYTFRSGDRRWTHQLYTVVDVFLTPGWKLWRYKIKNNKNNKIEFGTFDGHQLLKE